MRDRDIVIFTYADWRAAWSTPQQTALRLAPHNRVLYVDQPRSFLFNFKPQDTLGAGTWSGPPLQEVLPRLWVLHLPHRFLPVGGIPLGLAKAALEYNGARIAAHTRKAMQHLGFQDPILWNFSPLHGAAVRRMPRALAVYDIADVWVNYIHNRPGRQVIEWMEERLCREADIVFPSTDSMFQRYRHLNPEMHVVPHGADYPHFAKAALDETTVPDDIAHLPRPVIGTIGVMDPERFDADLIASLAQARPTWSFVLVGPARREMDLTRFEKLPNVYLMGSRPIADLPHFLKGMNVTLIPYKINEATRDIYPLKLQEYLSAGRPVVSSAMPAVLPYANVVRIARSHEEFLPQIEAALEEDSHAHRAARQAVARENSWEARVTTKSEHLERLLSRHQTKAATP